MPMTTTCPTGPPEHSPSLQISVGHVVVMGMDFHQVGASAQQLLGNAVFLPAHDPVRLLDYREHSAAQQTAHVNETIATEATARGRGVEWTTAGPAAALPSLLNAASHDVLLVHHQPYAKSGELGLAGSLWAPALGTFTAAGGVVVVLATGSGTGEMAELLTNAGLLTTSGFESITGLPAYNQAPGDAIGLGVLSPFLAKPTTNVLQTFEAEGPSLLHVITSAGGDPVVVHKLVME
jgi:hypothetical protein